MFRKDEKSYDIEELYQFADQTGILERHKQLLAQPFHEDQVTSERDTRWYIK